MNILKEAAVAIGDHVTAPVRKISYEIRIGCKADIERVQVWTDEGQFSRSHIEWFIVPENATRKERSAIIEEHD